MHVGFAAKLNEYVPNSLVKRSCSGVVQGEASFAVPENLCYATGWPLRKQMELLYSETPHGFGQGVLRMVP